VQFTFVSVVTAKRQLRLTVQSHFYQAEESKMDNSIITTVLTSTVISAIVTGLFSVLSRRRTERIDNITKERKAWRDNLRSISSEISKCRDAKTLKNAIDKLKVRVNPYGAGNEEVFKDSYIWELIIAFETHEFNAEPNETKTNTELERYKAGFTNYISCLLKNDWDRSKREIDGGNQVIGVALLLAVGVGLYAVRCYLAGSGYEEKFFGFIEYCAILYFSSGFTVLIVTLSNKCKDNTDFDKCNDKKILCYLLVILYFLMYIGWLWCNTFISRIDATEAIIFSIPTATLLYVACASICEKEKSKEKYNKAIESFKKALEKSHNEN
jgi:hypothetical protein